MASPLRIPLVEEGSPSELSRVRAPHKIWLRKMVFLELGVAEYLLVHIEQVSLETKCSEGWPDRGFLMHTEGGMPQEAG